MKIYAEELAAGDVLQMHDWQLHVETVEFDPEAAVRTTEFTFPLHFGRHDAVEILGTVGESIATFGAARSER